MERFGTMRAKNLPKATALFNEAGIPSQLSVC